MPQFSFIKRWPKIKIACFMFKFKWDFNKHFRAVSPISCTACYMSTVQCTEYIFLWFSHLISFYGQCERQKEKSSFNNHVRLFGATIIRLLLLLLLLRVFLLCCRFSRPHWLNVLVSTKNSSNLMSSRFVLKSICIMVVINMQFPNEKFINQISLCCICAKERTKCIKYARVPRKSFTNEIRVCICFLR